MKERIGSLFSTKSLRWILRISLWLKCSSPCCGLVSSNNSSLWPSVVVGGGEEGVEVLVGVWIDSCSYIDSGSRTQKKKKRRFWLWFCALSRSLKKVTQLMECEWKVSFCDYFAFLRAPFSRGQFSFSFFGISLSYFITSTFGTRLVRLIK